MVRSVLFVCTGNICRSPTAEGVARDYARGLGLEADFHFESAATHGYHVGDPPDPRTLRAARGRGYDLSGQRARRVTEFDFERFDLVLAMGYGHLEWLRRACPRKHHGKLRLFLSFVEENLPGEVPDPYYGEMEDFEKVLDIVEEGVAGLFRELNAPP